MHLTRADVVKIIRDFLDGTGGAHDWDDFLSLKLDDPELEKIRLFAGDLPDRYPEHPAQFGGYRVGGYCSAEGILKRLSAD